MNQSALVALVVVAAFGVGVFTGRAMMSPSSSPAPAAMMPSAAAPAATPFPSAGSPSAAPALPPNHPPVGGAAAAAPAAADGSLPSGTIAEVLQVPNYTYLRITTSRGDVWAAVNSNPQLAVGQKVALANASKMEGFASKTLNRTFDEIWFGSLAEGSN
jgi:hypothetical protein